MVMIQWEFDVSIWKNLPRHVANDILMLVLDHVPEDPRKIPSAPTHYPRPYRTLANGIWA